MMTTHRFQRWSFGETGGEVESYWHERGLVHGGSLWAKGPDPHYDVRAWGAVGDGVADDTAAIQAALDAAGAAGGGEVHLPAGTYSVSVAPHPDNAGYLQGLIIHSGTVLCGAGIGRTVVKVANAQPDWSAIVRNRNIGTALDSSITLRDLTLDGNAANQAGAGYQGVAMLRARGVRFENVRVKNVRGTTTSGTGEGFHFEVGLCTDVFYTNCEVVGDAGSTATGFSADSSNMVRYVNCIARGMTVCAGFTHYACRNVQYVNCHGYLNATAQFNGEVSTDIQYVNCVAGGYSASVATAGFPTPNTDLGGAYGFVVSSSTNTLLSNCTALANGTDLVDNGTSTVVVGCNIGGVTVTNLPSGGLNVGSATGAVAGQARVSDHVAINIRTVSSNPSSWIVPGSGSRSFSFPGAGSGAVYFLRVVYSYGVTDSLHNSYCEWEGAFFAYSGGIVAPCVTKVHSGGDKADDMTLALSVVGSDIVVTIANAGAVVTYGGWLVVETMGITGVVKVTW